MPSGGSRPQTPSKIGFAARAPTGPPTDQPAYLAAAHPRFGRYPR
jgi:hypothetical protein